MEDNRGSPSSPRFYSVSFQDRFTEVTPLLSPETDLEEGRVIGNAPNQTTVAPFGPRIGAQRTKSLSQIPNYSTIKEKNNSLILCCHGKEFGDCCNDKEDLRNEEVPPSEGHPCHAVRYSFDDRNARRKLIMASILCLVFMIGEIIGGYLANSLAIMTDAAHLLTDFASFMISLFSLYLACRPATKRLSFGWYRSEVIGALTSVILIWVVTGILVYIAIERIINKTYEVDADIMLITSGVGVAVNIIMGLVLHCQGHGHSHGGLSHASSGHSHGDKKDENINVRAALIHVIGDFLQSVGVFVAALIIFFKKNWGIVDPICTFIFSVLVLGTTIAILKDVMTVLMEGIPKGIDFNEVKEAFMNIPGVVKVHNLRIWCLSLDKVALAAHVVISPGVNTQDVLKHASRLVRQRFTFFEMTLQIEEYHEDMLNCTQCEGPPD